MWVGLLGASVAFGSKSHLGVDYFVGKLEPSAQKAMFVVVQLAVLAFAASAMVYGGWLLVTETLAKGQVTTALGMKMGHVYLAMPISGVFIVLYALENISEVVLGWGESREQAVVKIEESPVEAEVRG
jgi:TRAP-type C4-dicarboxylate transport system permease small subunit